MSFAKEAETAELLLNISMPFMSSSRLELL